MVSSQWTFGVVLHFLVWTGVTKLEIYVWKGKLEMYRYRCFANKVGVFATKVIFCSADE